MAARTRARPRLDRRTRAARAEGLDSRERLLSAAGKVFAQQGFAAAKVDDIAAEAGLSKGAVYWNFDSKEELFLALHEERIDRRIREMVELLESAPRSQDMAPEASRLLQELLQEEPEMVLLSHEFWSIAVRDPKLRSRHAARGRELRAALAGALESRREHLGAPDFSMPSEEAATAFIALADGLSLLKLVDPGAVPEHLYGEVLSLVYEGLVARAQRSEREVGSDSV